VNCRIDDSTVEVLQEISGGLGEKLQGIPAPGEKCATSVQPTVIAIDATQKMHVFWPNPNIFLGA
jgi:hypothetical protein